MAWWLPSQQQGTLQSRRHNQRLRCLGVAACLAVAVHRGRSRSIPLSTATSGAVQHPPCVQAPAKRPKSSQVLPGHTTLWETGARIRTRKRTSHRFIAETDVESHFNETLESSLCFTSHANRPDSKPSACLETGVGAEHMTLLYSCLGSRLTYYTKLPAVSAYPDSIEILM